MAALLGALFAVAFYGCYLLVGWWFLLIMFGALVIAAVVVET